MNKEKQGFSAFLLHFLERLNSDKTIEAKITESLTDICKYNTSIYNRLLLNIL